MWPREHGSEPCAKLPELLSNLTFIRVSECGMMSCDVTCGTKRIERPELPSVTRPRDKTSNADMKSQSEQNSETTV